MSTAATGLTRETRIFDDDGPTPHLFAGVRGVEPQIRVEEHIDGDTMRIRAEAPGIDPEKDVSVTLAGDVLSISIERRSAEKTNEQGYSRTEFRYGSFARSIRLPEGTNPADVHALYKDGILEITVPISQPSALHVTKVPVERG